MAHEPVDVGQKRRLHAGKDVPTIRVLAYLREDPDGAAYTVELQENAEAAPHPSVLSAPFIQEWYPYVEETLLPPPVPIRVGQRWAYFTGKGDARKPVVIRILGVYGYGSGGNLYTVTLENSEIRSTNGLSERDIREKYTFLVPLSVDEKLKLYEAALEQIAKEGVQGAPVFNAEQALNLGRGT